MDLPLESGILDSSALDHMEKWQYYFTNPGNKVDIQFKIFKFESLKTKVENTEFPISVVSLESFSRIPLLINTLEYFLYLVLGVKFLCSLSKEFELFMNRIFK